MTSLTRWLLGEPVVYARNFISS